MKSVGIRATSLLPATLTKTTLPHVRLCLKTRSAVALLPILPDRACRYPGSLALSCFKNKSIGFSDLLWRHRTRHDGIHGWTKWKRKKRNVKYTAEQHPPATLALDHPVPHQDSPSCDLDSFRTSMPFITTPSPYGSTPPCQASIQIINNLLRFPASPAVDPTAQQYANDP